MVWLNIIIATISIGSLGCFFHFAYNASHKNKFIGFFSAVNESVWEHIKIALSGLFVYSIITAIIFGSMPNYLVALALSAFLMITLIPAIYYPIRMIIKKEIIWLDIIEFFLVVLASQWAFFSVLYMGNAGLFMTCASVVALIFIFACYAIFTFFPPKLEIFRDPTNGKYGLKASSHEKKRVNVRRSKKLHK